MEHCQFRTMMKSAISHPHSFTHSLTHTQILSQSLESEKVFLFCTSNFPSWCSEFGENGLYYTFELGTRQRFRILPLCYKFLNENAHCFHFRCYSIEWQKLQKSFQGAIVTIAAGLLLLLVCLFFIFGPYIIIVFKYRLFNSNRIDNGKYRVAYPLEVFSSISYICVFILLIFTWFVFFLILWLARFRPLLFSSPHLIFMALVIKVFSWGKLCNRIRIQYLTANYGHSEK